MKEQWQQMRIHHTNWKWKVVIAVGVALLLVIGVAVFALKTWDAASREQNDTRWSTLTILWQNLLGYAEEHGRFPDTLEEVAEGLWLTEVDLRGGLVYTAASLPCPRDRQAKVRMFYERESRCYGLFDSGYHDFYDFGRFFREAPPGEVSASVGWSLVDEALRRELEQSRLLTEEGGQSSYDTDRDGRADLWFWVGWLRSFDTDGDQATEVQFWQGSRSGHDTNGDGRPDRWVYRGDLETYKSGLSTHYRQLDKPRAIHLLDKSFGREEEVELHLYPHGWTEYDTTGDGVPDCGGPEGYRPGK